jgi:hypothetical protein
MWKDTANGMHSALNATTNLEHDQTQCNEVRQSCVKGGMVVGWLVMWCMGLLLYP